MCLRGSVHRPYSLSCPWRGRSGKALAGVKVDALATRHRDASRLWQREIQHLACLPTQPVPVCVVCVLCVCVCVRARARMCACVAL